MKLSQMRYFQAVCLYGSTTRAADSLFVSQPSISMAIKELVVSRILRKLVCRLWNE